MGMGMIKKLVGGSMVYLQVMLYEPDRTNPFEGSAVKSVPVQVRKHAQNR
jgi:tRNA A37 N6-isopentenylltransferase MiaA